MKAINYFTSSVKFILFLGLCLGVSACSQKKATPEEIKTVKVARVIGAFGSEQKNLSGIVKEAEEIKLSFRIAGPIHRSYVKEGQYVHKGQLLAEIDPRDYKVQLSASKAQYEQVNAEASRISTLYKHNNIAGNDYDKAIAGRRMAHAQYENSRNQLHDVKLIAPFSGYIQEVYFHTNETVAAGMPVVSMIDISSLEVDVEISASLYLKKDRIRHASYTMTERPGISYSLQPIDVVRKANLNNLYKLRFRATDMKSGIAPGMTVSVSLNLADPGDQALRVPVSAVFEQSGLSYVWVYNQETQRVNKREVQQLSVDTEGNERVLGVLQSDDLIVSAGVHSLRENQKVKLLNGTI